MKCTQPSVFRDGETLDPERINAGLRALGDCLTDNLSRRWTHFVTQVPLDGLADTDALGARFVPLVSAAVDRRLTLEGIELYLPTASGIWTVTSTHAAWDQDLVLDTSGGSDVTYEGTELELLGADDYLELQGSAGATITRGWMVLHFRADRAHTADHSGYTPDLLDDTDTDAAARLTNGSTGEWDKVADASARDLANSQDRVPTYFTRRSLTAGAGLLPENIRREPSALRGWSTMQTRASGDATATVTARLKDEGGTIRATNSVACSGTGAVDGADVAGIVDQTLDDATDSADDWTIEIEATGTGTVLAAHVVLFQE